MPKFDVRTEQSKIRLRFDIDEPMAAFVRDFLIPDQPREKHPLLSMSPEFLGFAAPTHFEPGAIVPVVYALDGCIHLSTAVWGIPRSDGEPRFYDDQDMATIAIPVLIPYSSASWAGSNKAAGTTGRNYFAATGGLASPDGRVEYVASLIRRVSLVAPWTPINVPISPIPTLSNFEFLRKSDRSPVADEQSALRQTKKSYPYA